MPAVEPVTSAVLSERSIFMGSPPALLRWISGAARATAIGAHRLIKKRRPEAPLSKPDFY
jgi:hypothetical protein